MGVIGGLVIVENKNVIFKNNYISDSKGYKFCTYGKESEINIYD